MAMPLRKRRLVMNVTAGGLAVAALVLTVVFLVPLLSPTGSAGPGIPPQGETLKTPVYDGIPGALPRHFHYRYDTVYHGWPVAPVDARHPIRGGFADPRGLEDDGLSGYHFGIDVSVDDRHPDAGAPKGLSHRVYALDSGWVTVNWGKTKDCGGRRVNVGHFSYWHTSPAVRSGQHIKAGEQIGWTCRNYWHVHISEWQRFRGVRVWVNPLHAGSPLRFPPGAYVDRTPPVIHRLVFVTPPATPWRPKQSLAEPDTSTRLSPNALHGLVELRANINDPQSFLGFLAQNPAWPTAFSPYQVAVQIRSASGRLLMSRVSFRADQLPQTPYLVHYAPGTVQDKSMSECVGPAQQRHCEGTFWVRPFSRFKEEYWDTRRVKNGDYLVTVLSRGVTGESSSKTIRVTVRN
jgi:hypothetical protein